MKAAGARGDAFQAPLDADLLIEASAGTGKTYALTTLVARLIVEEDRGIDELLVVTFTVAAAGELRARIRGTLHTARRAASGTDARSGDDDQAARLRQSWRRADVKDEQARERLVRALRDIDRATITTIHGFCQQALGEFALPAGIPFSFEVSGDDALAVGDGVRDFWRRRMVGESIALLEYAKSKSFVPGEPTTPWTERTTEWVARQHARPQEIRGVPGNLEEDLRTKKEEWTGALRAVEQAWAAGGRSALLKVVHQHSWRKGKRPDQDIAALVSALDSGAAEDLAPDFVGRFGHKKLTPRLFKNDPPPDDAHIFDIFQLVGDRWEAYAQTWLAGQRRRLLEGVRNTFHHNAWADRRLGFDALLVELHRALDGERGPELARRIRSRYPIGLIDEFQDTDRLQAEIFSRIYLGGHKPSDVGSGDGRAGEGNSDNGNPSDGSLRGDPASGRLFVVGDPKQSIYRFRGADVFAYLETQDRLSASRAPLRLEHNYRSTPGLIRAVGELFSRPTPFVLPAFTFEPSKPAPREHAGLDVDGEGDSAPFQFVLIPKRPAEKRNKSDLTRLAARQAASEIARLIALGAEGGAALVPADKGSRERLAGRHIAVLVRTGAQGKAVAEALRSLEIGSVELGTDSIFDSAEADALHRLLRALCLDGSEYNAASLLRGALAADLFGLDMRELAGLRDDDDAWDHWRGLAREWADVWQQQGIATLMRRILFGGEPDCSANLLRYPDGPRRLTNYLHLSDLLHEAEIRRRPSRHGLVDWFRQSRADSRTSDETAQLRLDSDEDLVKIVTVHRAKGLEFPIVFYPFAWDGREPKKGRNRKPTAEYYDPDRKTPVLDLRPSDEAYDRERVEEHADELRLLYVALTRARFRNVVTWAAEQRAEHAPMAWLLHNRTRSVVDDPAQALTDNAKHVKNLEPSEWREEVHGFAARAPRLISIREIDAEASPAPAAPEPADTDELAVRELGRELKLIRQRTSYSALSADAIPRVPAHDAEGSAPAVPAPPASPRMPVRDRDEVDLVQPGETIAVEAPETEASPEEAGPSIFSLPAGGRTGRCLHEIFERLLGSPEPPELEEACADALARHGFGQQWLPVARSLVANALDTPLMRPGEAGGVFRLSDLEAAIAEMEFHLPLPALGRPELGRCLKEHGYNHRIAQDDDARIEGFLHGFIDLAACHEGRWYVIDYKSNRLGPDLSAYSDRALADAMREHGYHLQYLLYLTALHRLLRLRLPDYDYDRHIGGAFYLFLRGMRPNVPGSGVFRDRPTRDCIEALDACLGGSEAEAAPDDLGGGGGATDAAHSGRGSGGVNHGARRGAGAP